jgi:alpha-1,6-mannosyltransferase
LQQGPGTAILAAGVPPLLLPATCTEPMGRFRVCDVNDLFSMTGGGIRRYHLEKLRFFAKRDDLEYHLLIPSDVSRIEVHGTARIHHVPATKVSSDGYRFMLNPLRLRKVLHSIAPDVVEVGSPYNTPDWVQFALRGLDCQVVGFWHGNFPVVDLGRVMNKGGPWLGKLGERIGWWWARRTYGHFAVTMAATHVMIDELTANGIQQIRHTPLGCDTKMFHPRFRDPALRAQWGAGPDDVVMIWPNRLATDKNYHLLLQAYELIRTRTERKPILVVVGHGKGTAEVQAVAAKYPEEVFYLGYLQNPRDVARIIASADVSAALSPYETFGLAAVEAMSCGLGLVGAAHMSIGEILAESQCGIGLTVLSAETVADAWLQMLDPERARAFGRRARTEAVARYSWKATFERILEVYQEVMQDAARQRLGESTVPLLAGPDPQPPPLVSPPVYPTA